MKCTKPFLLTSFSVLGLLLAGCSGATADNNVVTLRIYNAEDYIADGSDDSIDVIELFKEYVYETDGVTINVTYDSYDTNESMFADLQTGARNYDLICASDYMIQKMMGLNMLQPFLVGEERQALYENGHGYEGWETDNYEEYHTRWFDEVYGGITVENSYTHETLNFSDYMRGYMWGTLGLMYNPTFSTYADRGLEPEDVHRALKSYSSLWIEEFRQTFQIKDSMRDSYALALLETYKEDFEALKVSYESGTLSEDDYNDDINIIFNNICHIDEFNEVERSIHSDWTDVTANDIISAVEVNLSELRDLSYGLEVDSGKTDIQSGTRIGINFAWSGDAVYAIDSAETNANPVYLYYSVPDIGGNLWLDAWMISRDASNQEYAQKFIDFVSRPDIAAGNMDYVGYSTAIAGDTILETAQNWYDARLGVFYEWDDEAEDYAYDEEGNYVEVEGLSYEDFDNAWYNGVFTLDDVSYSSWENYGEVNEEEWTEVDLSYYFNDSLTEYENDVDTIFWTTEYEHYENEDGSSFYAGRSFYAQYPPGDIVPSLMVMEDYGDQNEYVLIMWETVKNGTVPTWLYIVLITEIVIAVLGIGALVGTNMTKKRLRKRRLEEAKTSH